MELLDGTMVGACTIVTASLRHVECLTPPIDWMTYSYNIYIPRAMQLYHARAKDLRAKDQQPRTKRRGPCKSQGPGTKDQEPWTMSPAGTKSHMLRAIRTKSPGPSAKDHEPWSRSQEPHAIRAKDPEPRTKRQGPWMHEPRTKSEGPIATAQE